MSRTGENIYKRKDGRWEARYIKGYENNKTKYGYLYARNYKDVKEKLRTANKEFIDKSNSKNNFSYWLDSWLKLSKSRVKESTYVRYSNSIKNHIKPEIGNINISDINTMVVENFLTNKLQCGRLDSDVGLSPKTVADMLIIIKDTVKYASSEGENVFCHFERISIKKKVSEMRVLTEIEQQRILQILHRDTDMSKMGVLLCMFTGIRIGELCALKWGNIHFENKTMNIEKTMQRIQYIDENQKSKTHIIITEPKSAASIRTIPLPESIISILSKFKSSSDAYILTGKTNSYIEPRTMQNRFKKYLILANVEAVNFHSLRHTFATRCIELGFDIKSLSEILGHVSVKTTLDKYVHSSIEVKRNDMKKLDLLCG